MITKLLAANIATILFLAFTVWCLYTGHTVYAGISFIVAIIGSRTLDSK